MSYVRADGVLVSDSGWPIRDTIYGNPAGPGSYAQGDFVRVKPNPANGLPGMGGGGIQTGGINGGTVSGGTGTPQTAQGGLSAEDLQKIADPFYSQRGQYQNQLSKLMSDPSSIADTGQYKFAFNQGQQALERSQAAKGMNLSGNALAQLSDYGQGMASQQFGQQANLLSHLSGADTGSPAGAASAIVAQNNNANNTGFNYAQLNSSNYWNQLRQQMGQPPMPTMTSSGGNPNPYQYNIF